MKSQKVEYLRFDNLRTGLLQKGRRYLRLVNAEPAEEVFTTVEHLDILRELSNLFIKHSNSSDLYLKNTILNLHSRLGSLKKKNADKNFLSEEERIDLISEMKSLSLHLDKFHFLPKPGSQNENKLVEEIKSKYEALSNSIKDFFDPKKIIPSTRSAMQIDLVLNATELGLLPYELLLKKNGKPYFADPKRELVLTRRIRQKKLGEKINWLFQPRVLFVYSDSNIGTFGEVPSEDHLLSLKEALRKTVIDKNFENHLITLKGKNANIKKIGETLAKAEKNGKPFSHVHILAHGAYNRNSPSPLDHEYGVALWSSEKLVTPVVAFKSMFESLITKPIMVTYMVCRGGAFSNPLNVDKNIVQVTHQVGIPIVIGSQFPLSYSGSNLITEIFYKNIFEGIDVRSALHKTRCELYKRRKKTKHDWLGLVAYVSLPEGYEDYLKKSRIFLNLQSMKNIQKQTEIILKSKSFNAKKHKELDGQLEGSIDKLERTFDQMKELNTFNDIYEENAGLIGSAYKRRAELILFKRQTNVTDSKEDADLFKKEKRYLKKALDSYKEATNYNAAHHWSSVQFISLNMVLNKKLTERIHWKNALNAAKKDSEKEDEIWAFGSLAELYLLRSKYKSDIENAKEAVGVLIDRAKDAQDPFFIKSTYDQLNRYVNWWVPENGYKVQKRSPEKERVLDLLGLLKKGLSEVKKIPK